MSMEAAAIEETYYQVYLLRIWRERPPAPGHPAAWRFSLEDVSTHRRRGFANLDSMVGFLQELTGAGGAGSTEVGRGPPEAKVLRLR